MIRTYKDSDRERLLDVWYRASRQAHSFLSEEFLLEERRLIAEEWLPASRTWVYEVDGQIAGFLSLVGDEIGGLFVAPEYQRRGIGTDLIATARAVARNLHLYVFAQNEQARAFYERCGFRTVDRGINAETGFPEVHMHMAD